MSRKYRYPAIAMVALAALPLLVIGLMVWTLIGLMPSCTIAESQRISSPDGTSDLVIFSRTCGQATPANTQATILPAGQALPMDVASFASVGTEADLAPRWDAYGNIELTLPAGAEIYKNNDTVAGYGVIYR